MAANTGMQARFYKGNVVSSSPYTPSGADVVAGQVVIVGNTPRIATQAIEDGELGELNDAGGIYKCIGDAAIGVGVIVYWDDTNNKVTATATSNKVFGWTISACAADDGECLVFHMPRP